MNIFEKDEMTLFIDVLLDYANQNGVKVDEYY